MLKAIIEWFLSLFVKDNVEEVVVEPIFEETSDEHIIVVNDVADDITETEDDNTYIINELEIMQNQNTLELELIRRYFASGYTIGRMYIDGNLFSDTIEDKDRELYDEMSLDQIKKIKVYGETAIPYGRYEIKMTYSPKFSTRVWGKKYNGYVPQLMDVKGFDGIRIHPLNTAKDSLGCIGCGENKEKGKVLNSTEFYYRLLNEHILPALDGGKRVYITVKK